mgnify:CR=1 FL=1
MLELDDGSIEVDLTDELEPDDDDPEAPWTPEAQARFDRMPLAVGFKKLVSAELADTRRELRRTLRGVRDASAAATAASDSVASLQAEIKALRRAVELEQALSDEPTMTPARRTFLRQLHTAQQPEDFEAWLTASLATMTTKGK